MKKKGRGLSLKVIHLTSDVSLIIRTCILYAALEVQKVQRLTVLWDRPCGVMGSVGDGVHSVCKNSAVNVLRGTSVCVCVSTYMVQSDVKELVPSC